MAALRNVMPPGSSRAQAIHADSGFTSTWHRKWLQRLTIGVEQSRRNGSRLARDSGLEHGGVGHRFALEMVVGDDEQLLGFTSELERPIAPRLELFGGIQIVVPLVHAGVV